MLSLNLNNVRVFCDEPEWLVSTAFNVGYRIMLAHVFRQRVQVVFICERRRLDDILVIHGSVLLQTESLALVPIRSHCFPPLVSFIPTNLSEADALAICTVAFRTNATRDIRDPKKQYKY